MKERITKEQVAQRSKDFTHRKFWHGGSRMFIDGDHENRKLLIDTYFDHEFAEYIEKCVREYFGLEDGV